MTFRNIPAYRQAGLIATYHLIEGKEVIGNFFFEHSFVGDFQSFVTRQPALQNIDALEDSQLLYTSYQRLQDFYAAILALQQFGRLMIERLFVYSQQRTASFLFDSPEQCYLKLRQQRPKMMQRVPQCMIASYFTPKARIRKRMASHE